MYMLREASDFQKMFGQKEANFLWEEKEVLPIVMELCINQIDPEAIFLFCLNVISTCVPLSHLPA